LCYYEYKRIVTHDGKYVMNPFQSFVGGMIAGILSSFGNQPFDVLKTRMQGVRAEEQYSSTWDCICKTYTRDGIPGFCEYLLDCCDELSIIRYDLIPLVLVVFIRYWNSAPTCESDTRARNNLYELRDHCFHTHGIEMTVPRKRSICLQGTGHSCFR